MPQFATQPEIPLIPRSALFGNPQRMGARISMDGRYLCWAAPDAGVMNLWVAPLSSLGSAKQVTHDRGRGITSATWAYDGEYLLYSQDCNGDENFHIYAVKPDGSPARDLTPFLGARAVIAGLSRRAHLRGKVLVSLNKRDPRYADLYLLDIASGEMELVQENPGFGGFLYDDEFRVLLAEKSLPDGGKCYLKPDGATWRPWLTLSADDARGTELSHVDAAGKVLYLYDNRGRDTAALVSIALDAESGDAAVPTVIGEDPRADVSGVLVDNESYRPLAYSVIYERNSFLLLDETLRADVEFLDAISIGDWSVVSRSEDDRYWIVGINSDVVPGAAHLYDRQSRTMERLYVTRPELLDAPLARMQSTVIRTRDGLDMVSYLTLPVDMDDHGHPLRSKAPVPLVLLVHGGPWARDYYGYNSQHQWLANRGYAVLTVNFRGSTGFGKRFAMAVEGEWGRKMDDDLCDAVDWAIERGIADSARVAIMGGSYGGYATLWAMTRHSDRYACGVDIVGPSNLETLLASIPPHWASFRAQFNRALGDPETEEGRALLRERSPLHYADQIRKPLLIGQGANDPRVKQAESDQMFLAMQDKGVPCVYVLFPDEGHGFARPANGIMFNILTERFLKENLGGRFQEESPREAEGNTAIVRANH